ncbi:MAG: NEW3 domain-containing protein [Anaerolineaceae bacterium]|jgi:hypothetical protein|nr:NEW3 domain-containing protein [Anaerolineaceae bacterium]
MTKPSFLKIISITLVLLSLLALSVVPALAQPQPAPLAAPGVTLSGPDTKSGTPGSNVTFTLSLENTGDASDTFDLSVGGGAWTSQISPASLTLDANASATVTVVVSIPASASTGDDTVTAVAASQTDPAIITSLTLTTTAVAPTATVPPPGAVNRPLLVIPSYTAGGAIAAGKDFRLDVSIRNIGQAHASNVIVDFESTDFLPLETGGLRALPSLVASNSASVSQSFRAGEDTAGKTNGTISAAITYSDSAGNSYSDTFTLTIELQAPVYTGAAYATKTPTSMPRPQIMVGSYTSDVDPLQPGSIFNLSLDIRNQGNSEARAVTMILGGGSVEMTGGTPQPGTTGGSGDVTNFAPLGSSNLYYLGDIPAGGGLSGTQQLIVNVNTNPGAYPLKLSFVYNDVSGNRVVDDQIITLLVYGLPQVEAGFYQDPGMIPAGQPAPLPLQITNLGRKTTTLGNMKITAAGAELTNNTGLIGSLEPGGYYTLDPLLIASQPGELELEITINYTDDFNQPRTINQTLSVTVEEALPMEPMDMDMPMPEVQPETFMQKIVRFIKGLFGLDSAVPEPEFPAEMFPPGEDFPPMEPSFEQPLG